MEHVVEIPDNIETVKAAFGKDLIMGIPVREEIIRCRDCKHFKSEKHNDGLTYTKCSGVFTFIKPTPDGFCAWAERRDDD